MTSLCDNCAFSKSDCKGNKDDEKLRCLFYKKPVVFNAKEAAYKIARLEAENDYLYNRVCSLEDRLYELTGEVPK